jgi:beta-glucosidase
LKKRVFALSLVFFLIVVLCPFSGFAEDETPIYQDKSYSFEERAADLVYRMTAAQKGSQMLSTAAAVPALGLSSYQWWSEAIHGHSRGNATNPMSYPVSYSVASSWNPDLYYLEATEIGNEIRESVNGRNLNLTLYSPTVNLARDPRWGRNDENYGEDPFLAGTMGTAFTQGMEGKDKEGNLLDPNGYYKTVTTAKHYTANNSEGNRLSGGADTDIRSLREYYTAPYRDMILNAGTSSVMTAYSTVNGVPVSMSSYLMDTLLRQTWGFDGYVTSDCDSVSTIARHNYVNPHTGKVLTVPEQFASALAHGEDLECNGGHSNSVGTYGSNMTAMLSGNIMTDKGLFTENQVDVSLHRLMTARMKVGEFDGNTSYVADANARLASYTGTVARARQTAERLKLATDIGSESVVLLKNEAASRKDGSTSKLLPLQIPATGAFNVAIVGVWAQDAYLGLYSANPGATVNIQTGITNAIKAINPTANVTYYKGFTNNGTDVALMASIDQTAIEAAALADLCIVVTGTNQNYSREDGDRANIYLPGAQADLISAVGKANKNTVALMETCGPMQVTTFEGDVSAIVWSSFAGQNKGDVFANVLTGKVNPSGKLTALWHKNVSNDGPSDLASIYDYTLYKTETTPGRTYMYFDGPVSYPFGYGLSYTTFEYSNLKLNKSVFDANETITATFDVKNTGAIAGAESAQLYVAQPNAPAALQRPIKRLKGFDKVMLAAGETKTISIQVKIPDLAFFNEAQEKYIVDTGAYEIQIGKSSADIQLRQNITVSGSINVVPKVLTVKANQSGDAALDIAERLIFNKGKVVNPQLTVAMNDESLYGYIIKGKSKALPTGTSVTYTSNRPSVAKVENNVITTVEYGVATITATLSYNGVTVSEDFIVYVSSTPYPDGITVNGDPISGFNKDKTDYSVCIPDSVTEIPAVSIIDSGNPTVTTVITQAETIPGVATIVATDSSTGQVATYRVGFTRAPKSADFKTMSDISIKPGVVIKYEGTGETQPKFSISSAAPLEASLIVAAYDSNGKLINKSTSSVSLEGGSASTLAATLDPGAASYKFFIWDSNFVPLTGVTGVALPKLLPEEWSVQNSVADSASLTGDGLMIKTARGAYASAVNKPQNVVLQSAGGDYVAQTTVSLSAAPSASNQQAGLVIYGDNNNYMRLVYERPTTGTSNVVRVYQVTNGTQTQRNTANVAAGVTKMSFQINKQNDIYTFLYSLDGENWTTFATTVAVTYATPMIGLWANNGDTAAASINATFDRLGIYQIEDILPRLSSLTMDGVPLPSFNPEKFGYTFEYAQANGVAPVIAATASNPSKFDVTVKQADGIPGAATVTVVSEVARVTYNVYFNTYPVSASFVDGTMDSLWKVINEDKAQYSIDKGLGLRLPTQNGDIYTGNKTWYNAFVRPAAGNWDVVAKVYYPVVPNANYQQFMLLAWQDDDNYVKLDCETASLSVQFAREVNGSNSSLGTVRATAEPDGSVTLYFRISKDGNVYSAAFSKDGINYQTVGTSTTLDFENTQIGLFATKNSTGGSVIQTYCEYVTITRLNGIDVKPYDEMLQDAFENVTQYVFADIPAATSSDIVFSRVPRGYTVSAVSSNPAVLSNDGKVLLATGSASVNLTVTVTDGTRTETKVLPVTVSAP